MNIPPHIPREIPRSKVRAWCIGENTNHARVILVKPRDLKSWVDGINEMVKTAEAVLTKSGFIIINDEGESMASKTIRFPNATVDLTRIDGNAFAILGAVQRALRKAGATKEQQDEFMREATSGDYDNLLQTVMRWVETD